MYLNAKISVCDNEIIVPVIIEVGVTEEDKGGCRTGDYYVDEIVDIEIPVEFERWRDEISEKADEMLVNGELCDLAKEEAEAI